MDCLMASLDVSSRLLFYHDAMVLQVAFHDLPGGGTRFTKQDGNVSNTVWRPELCRNRGLGANEDEFIFHQDVFL